MHPSVSTFLLYDSQTYNKQLMKQKQPAGLPTEQFTKVSLTNEDVQECQ